MAKKILANNEVSQLSTRRSDAIYHLQLTFFVSQALTVATSLSTQIRQFILRPAQLCSIFVSVPQMQNANGSIHQYFTRQQYEKQFLIIKKIQQFLAILMGCYSLYPSSIPTSILQSTSHNILAFKDQSCLLVFTHKIFSSLLVCGTSFYINNRQYGNFSHLLN